VLLAGHGRPLEALAAFVAIGQGLARPLCLVLLAEAAGHAGQGTEGLRLLAEALPAFATSGRVTCSQRRIASRAHCCGARPPRIPPRRKPAFTMPSPLSTASRPNPGSCGPPWVWRVCGNSRASGPRPGSC